MDLADSGAHAHSLRQDLRTDPEAPAESENATVANPNRTCGPT